jgi:hypothetical protein
MTGGQRSKVKGQKSKVKGQRSKREMRDTLVIDRLERATEN